MDVTPGAISRIGRRVEVRGVGIWAEQLGPPDAVAVLLVQRMGALGFEWDPAIVEALLGSGYRVITYDQRGFGWSDDIPADRPLQFQELVDDAIGVLEAFDVTTAHLIGTSMGGVLARCVACQVPGLARTLVLIGSTPGAGELPVWSDEYAAVVTKPPGPSPTERVEYLVRELEVMCDDRFDPAAARLRAEQIVARGWSVDAVRRTIRAAKSRSAGESDLRQLASIAVPTLVVHGTADPVLTVDHGRRLSEAIPVSDYLELEGMSHHIQPHYVPLILERLLPVLAAGDCGAATDP